MLGGKSGEKTSLQLPTECVYTDIVKTMTSRHDSENQRLEMELSAISSEAFAAAREKVLASGNPV